MRIRGACTATLVILVVACQPFRGADGSGASEPSGPAAGDAGTVRPPATCDDASWTSCESFDGYGDVKLLLEDWGTYQGESDLRLVQPGARGSTNAFAVDTTQAVARAGFRVEKAPTLRLTVRFDVRVRAAAAATLFSVEVFTASGYLGSGITVGIDDARNLSCNNGQGQRTNAKLAADTWQTVTAIVTPSSCVIDVDGTPSAPVPGYAFPVGATGFTLLPGIFRNAPGPAVSLQMDDVATRVE